MTPSTNIGRAAALVAELKRTPGDDRIARSEIRCELIRLGAVRLSRGQVTALQLLGDDLEHPLGYRTGPWRVHFKAVKSLYRMGLAHIFWDFDSTNNTARITPRGLRALADLRVVDVACRRSRKRHPPVDF